MNRSIALAILILLVLGGVVLSVGPSDGPRLTPAEQQELQEIRNLGKAFYENPGTQSQAVEQFRKALEMNPGSAREHLNYGLALLAVGKIDEGIAELEKAKAIDPTIPHTYFNLGIEFKKRGETERAIQELERMAQLVPNEPKTQYNLGVLYKMRGDEEAAREKFELTAKLDPSLAAPHFQLYNMLRREEPEKAREELDRFRELKEQLSDVALVAEDVNWSEYAELYDPIDAEPAVEEAEVTRFERWPVSAQPLPGEPRGVTLLDEDGDRRTDLVAWSDEGFLLWRAEGERERTPFEDLRHIAAGDSNNDGRHDLAIVHAGGVSLRDGASGSVRELAAGDFNAALWVDYDHDYDLDLFLTGRDQKLLRNNGDGTFADVSGSFPFVEGTEGLAAVAIEFREDTRYNIVVAYSDGIVIYKDLKIAEFEPVRLGGIGEVEAPARLRAGDFNADGFLDVAVTSGRGPSLRTRILENTEGWLRARPKRAGFLAWADAQNRGAFDGLAAGRLFLDREGFEWELGASEGIPENLAAAAGADFDGDGRADFAVIGDAGHVFLLRNTTGVSNNYLSLDLKGVKNQVLAESARVEVKAGHIYGKRLYQGIPLLFGLGGAQTADTVRITWPNGMIQNESEQPAGQHYTYEEKPRLSGSCPMIFTWNGEKFEFISEVLGVGPLGAGLGGGEFFSVDHDEYVWVPAESLTPRDGAYEIRITEELREVAYIDQIQLLAVDHPAETDVFTNEKFKAPPFPEFRLFGVKDRIYPQSAMDHRGQDVRPRLIRRDRRYADNFERDFRNRAGMHSVTLDFPQLRGEDDVVLFLHGWVDWADASTIVAAGQGAGAGLVLPRLEVRGGGGEWITVMEDMGLPAGGPRTIAVDLSGKFPGESRQVRITTNLCLYWDEAFAAMGARPPQAELTRLDPSEARLRFRGFSEVTVHPQRKQPEHFNYARVEPVSNWNPTPGKYTRYGDVRELLTAIDDRFVIMGAGDEIMLRFRADELPAPPAGWRRDYLLFVDGWAKEQEANTAFGDSVEPLPFHQMSAYPYPGEEHYPDGELHREYLRKYVTRPALKLIRPLRRP